MLTISRSTDVNFIASQAIARQQAAQEGIDAGEDASDIDPAKIDAMAALERQARAPVGFVAASVGPEGDNKPKTGQDSEAANGNGVKNDAEIDLDDDL